MNCEKWEKFSKGFSDDEYEDIMVSLAEAAQSGDDNELVQVIDQDRIDAINVRASCVLTINDEEYSVYVEDGNWNGTVVTDFESDADFKRLERTKWTLAPINQADTPEKARVQLVVWDVFLEKVEVQEMLRKYTYDKFVQPGSQIANHYKEEAERRFGGVIVSEQVAADIRNGLEKLAEAVA